MPRMRISRTMEQTSTRRIPSRRERNGKKVLDRRVAKLVIIAGKKAGREDRCYSSRTYVGRARNNHVVIQESSVSRRHACIERRDGSFMLEDLDSTNGSILNRKPISREILHHGDKIQIGETVLQFILEEGN